MDPAFQQHRLHRQTQRQAKCHLPAFRCVMLLRLSTYPGIKLLESRQAPVIRLPVELWRPLPRSIRIAIAWCLLRPLSLLLPLKRAKAKGGLPSNLDDAILNSLSASIHGPISNCLSTWSTGLLVREDTINNLAQVRPNHPLRAPSFHHHGCQSVTAASSQSRVAGRLKEVPL
jgi:hypothetical protein